ncbi:Ig-like domain-containing protein [Catenovulum sp. 2E275]|uniref:reprolysin-like metallopeptidase n=1 Tax=Catenovulum sp. 2E275 TaxID=2980497 RepID=UPI0021CF2CD3|nr:Ig-like domain-containing protein [Catenovulum sp. 2E275]MCU4674287.1 Ig-like domain-containing protein [Catenovulum sp. 2E275]
MKYFYLLIAMIFCNQTIAQTWQEISDDTKVTEIRLSNSPSHTNNIYIKPESEDFKQALRLLANNTSTIELILPTPNNGQLIYLVSYDAIMPERLARKYPNILTFKGHLKGDKTQTGRFDLGPNGFHASYQINENLYYLDEYIHYQVYELYPYQSTLLEDEQLLHSEKPTIANKGSLDTDRPQNMTYRFAVATTGEYSLYFINRGLNVLNAVITSVNRINDIFQRDLAITLELVANNDALIYTNPNTDPFTNEDSEADLNNIQQTLDNEIGNSNYDIGHLFSTNPGGIAQVGGVCFTGYKGQGTSGNPTPRGDSFNIDLVSHELGHQFGAEHTYNGTDGYCNSGRENNHAYELGSGVTIMGYAGICENENIANSSIAVFHSKSIEKIYQTINSNGTTGSCGSQSSRNNQPPIANAGDDYIIPARTPFVLTASAIDPEGDDLTYSWEQIDLGEATSSKIQWSQTSSGPLFRNWLPNKDNKRYIPRLDDLANGVTNPTEILSNSSRTVNFRVAVRDQKGGVNFDDMQINVNADIGPLTVDKPAENDIFLGNQTITVSWQVNQTDLLCPDINILMSDDNANSFKYTLAEQVTNSGTAQVTLPNETIFLGKIMVKCSDNIFFNLSSGQFSITQIQNQQPIANNDSYSIDRTQINSINLDVIENDTDADGDSLTITQITYAGTGSTVINNNEIIYTPADNFTGTDTIIYFISDGIDTTQASVAITVMATSINTTPIANNDNYTIDKAQMASISLNVTENDTDMDGDNLTITQINYSGTGSATINNNEILYTPAEQFTGMEQITYLISDGTETSQASISIVVTTSETNTNEPPPAANDENNSGGAIHYLAIYLILLLKLIQKLSKRTELQTRIS